MVGQQDKAAPHQIGAGLVEPPQRGKLAVHRVRLGCSVADAGRQFVEDRPPGADDPGRGQIECRQILRRERRQPHLAAFDQPER